MNAALPLPRLRLRLRRALLWALLLVLLAVAQSLLVFLAVRYEASRAQEGVEAAATEAATQIRRDVLRLTQALQSVTWLQPQEPMWREAAAEALKGRPELRRLEWRDAQLRISDAVDSPFLPRLFSQLPRQEISVEAELACRIAQREATPRVSRSYYVPLAGGAGYEVMDLCVPVQRDGRDAGYLVGVLSLSALLEGAVQATGGQRHEISFVEGDGARLARAGTRRGTGNYVAEQRLDLPGQVMLLRADSAAGRPSLIPNLTTALVLGLSLALFAVVFLLARDVRRRALAEQALREAFGFRKAMEDSLSTGLRARDMDGAITYVNPAFCTMVGYGADELRAVPADQPPLYWPPERVAEYRERQRSRRAAAGGGGESYESVFMRKGGERFPVMVYEAPLLDGQGRQAGWMGSVLDLTAQRRIEEISRQQQERLQASARLASVGEMASLLSHELNQPLAAIASYAGGSLNLLADPAAQPTPAPLLQQALARIAEQAERAGRIIKSVHDLVRRREQLRETLGAELLFEAVLPLVRLQARKSGTRVELALPAAPQRAPRVVCDRTMVEQVLLNLTRNAIQAMEEGTVLAERVLTLQVHAATAGRVVFEVIDAGPGIAPEVAERLFTPFFTTRPEGMGLGLSLCRTVVEQHGGTLDFGPAAGGRGTAFRFTLPAAAQQREHTAGPPTPGKPAPPGSVPQG